MSQTETPRLLTVDEVATMLRTTTYSVTRKCRDRKLRATKPFGTWLIYAEDVEALLKSATREPAREKQDDPDDSDEPGVSEGVA